MYVSRRIGMLVTCLMCSEARARQQFPTEVDDSSSLALASLVLAFNPATTRTQFTPETAINVRNSHGPAMSGNRFSQRRQILSKVAAAVGAIGASPMAALARNKNQVTGASSKFTGEYEDSNHHLAVRRCAVHHDVRSCWTAELEAFQEAPRGKLRRQKLQNRCALLWNLL